MNGPHRVHHVDAKARRIAGSQYVYELKIYVAVMDDTRQEKYLGTEIDVPIRKLNYNIN